MRRARRRAGRGPLVLALLLFLPALALPAAADGYGNDGDGGLWRVRTRHGDVVRLGQVAIQEGERRYTPSLTDVALSPRHGLYAIGFHDLYRIDLEDPTRSTRVGSFTPSLNGLAFDGEDRLYGVGASGLYRIDLLTAAATHVGAFGVGGGSDGDIVFVHQELWATLADGGGTLLAQLDPATGRATTTHALREADGTRLEDVWGLSWDGRQLLGLCEDGRVYDIDRATGVARLLFRSKVRFWGGSVPLRR